VEDAERERLAQSFRDDLVAAMELGDASLGVEFLARLQDLGTPALGGFPFHVWLGPVQLRLVAAIGAPLTEWEFERAMRACLRGGQPGGAVKLFKVMEGRGIRPGARTYTTLMRVGYDLHT
jgi:pentatricopeptide repeat protein